GVPYIHSLFENAPAVASGVVRALRVKGNDHTLVLVVAGDGTTYDIGFGSLSGMLERNEDVLYICYDNEAYMNTGVQRSSATPFGASTTTSQAGKKIPGKQEWKKPIVEIAAAHQIPYAASASIAFYADLRSKLHKAVKIRGARFISIHSSCCIGWGFDSNLAVEVCRLAVETGLWKLFEVENGEFRITREPSFIPVEEYFKLQRRFKHLTKEQIEKIQQHVYEDWARLGVKPKK
ncbi:MAG: thiamine pyrophosphate-dependent enzyme, partial [Candidatus Micrarchaeia archaeon]